MIAHDPGARAGWAEFNEAGRLVRVERAELRPAPGERVIVEVPESRGGRTRATTDDLIKLATRAGDYVGFARAHGAIVETVTPSRWKGSVPKKIHHARIKASLSPAELALLAGASSDMIDAVGLGVWYLTERGQRRTVQ